MGAFEFFFSFYGLLLGLSVAVLATGVATAIQHRKAIRIGWLTPLLATFVALDIATFWDFAWNIYRAAPFSYGLLVVGLVIALTYFVAASLVFPHGIVDGMSLDDHFWANKTMALMLTCVANIVALAAAIPFILAMEAGVTILITYGFSSFFYLALVVPAAFARKARLFAILIGLHVALYLVLAASSVAFPELATHPLDGMTEATSVP